MAPEVHDTADVLVVGFGGAGACAALEAREHGADVLVIDRFDGGGATAISGGVVYAGQTTIQSRAGVTDSVDAMEAYLRAEVGDVVSAETLREFCDQSGPNIAWLAAQPFACQSMSRGFSMGGHGRARGAPPARVGSRS